MDWLIDSYRHWSTIQIYMI